ncbi:hypothetical protein M3Y99_01894900 [Aphelenchoides fujianensis]|nr:hypothetical protein M3Y99_01894900 [Aphelenchoides fujianensis]
MSIMDTVALIVCAAQAFGLEHVSANAHFAAFSCKGVAFISHVVSFQSMWCFWLMSALRYMATRRPLQYSTLWRIPFIAMSVTFLLASFLNSWLLISVSYDKQAGVCVQEYSTTTQIHRCADVFFAFFVPMFFVIYMDFSVLCCRIQSPLAADPMLQIVINRPNAEKRKSLNRFLVITAAIVILNLPENVLRLLSAFQPDLVQSGAIPVAVIVAMKAMYFTQFAFKAFYLTSFVYHRSVLSKTNSSRQLSLSFRQRLEESSHMIRERANTYSYRATTPVPPPLARNASFAALDLLMPGKNSF